MFVHTLVIGMLQYAWSGNVAAPALNTDGVVSVLTFLRPWLWYASPRVMSSGLSFSLDARLVLSHLQETCIHYIPGNIT